MSRVRPRVKTGSGSCVRACFEGIDAVAFDLLAGVEAAQVQLAGPCHGTRSPKRRMRLRPRPRSFALGVKRDKRKAGSSALVPEHPHRHRHSSEAFNSVQQGNSRQLFRELCHMICEAFRSALANRAGQKLFIGRVGTGLLASRSVALNVRHRRSIAAPRDASMAGYSRSRALRKATRGAGRAAASWSRPEGAGSSASRVRRC